MEKEMIRPRSINIRYDISEMTTQDEIRQVDDMFLDVMNLCGYKLEDKWIWVESAKRDLEFVDMYDIRR